MNFDKSENGLLPAIVRDFITGAILMQGYMNEEAYLRTLELHSVTFYSRSKGRLWTKGETSGNVLKLISIKGDCDKDSLLIDAIPAGPTCHTGSETCWGEFNTPAGMLGRLEQIIDQRAMENSSDSYTAKLLSGPIRKIAQKVGEEGVEVALAGVDEKKDRLISECADLFYHVLVLLKARNVSMREVLEELQAREK